MDMGKKQNNESFLEKLAETLDLPGDVVAGLPRMEITGCRALMMENHRGILQYSTEEIDIGGSQAVVKVFGEHLILRAMNGRELLIVGQIFKIEFVY